MTGGLNVHPMVTRSMLKDSWVFINPDTGIIIPPYFKTAEQAAAAAREPIPTFLTPERMAQNSRKLLEV